MTNNRYTSFSNWAEERKRKKQPDLENSLWQYVLDHSNISYNGSIEAVFTIKKKEDFMGKLKARRNGYRKNNEILIFKEAESKRNSYEEVRKKYAEFKKKYPVLAKHYSYLKTRLMKFLTFFRKKIQNFVIYLESEVM